MDPFSISNLLFLEGGGGKKGGGFDLIVSSYRK